MKKIGSAKIVEPENSQPHDPGERQAQNLLLFPFLCLAPTLSHQVSCKDTSVDTGSTMTRDLRLQAPNYKTRSWEATKWAMNPVNKTRRSASAKGRKIVADLDVPLSHLVASSTSIHERSPSYSLESIFKTSTRLTM